MEEDPDGKHAYRFAKRKGALIRITQDGKVSHNSLWPEKQKYTQALKLRLRITTGTIRLRMIPSN